MISSQRLSAGPKKNAQELHVHIIKLDDDSPAASGGPSAAKLAEAAALVGKPAETDIIVFAHQPWQMVNGQLIPHPLVHTMYPQTILKVSYSAKERVVWWSEQSFRITGINPSTLHGPAAGGAPAGAAASAAGGQAPANPFDGPAPPYDAIQEADAAAGTIWAVRAVPIVQAAVHHTYKITFNIGEDIDPDMEGTP
jgi:hypothetical protein